MLPAALPLLLGVAQLHVLLLLTATPIPHSVGDTCRSVAVPVAKQGLPADWAMALRDRFLEVGNSMNKKGLRAV